MKIITYDDLVKNVKSIIKEIPKHTYHKLFIGSLSEKLNI